MAPRSSVQFMPFHGFACNLGTAVFFPYGLRLQPHFPIIYVYIYLYIHILYLPWAWDFIYCIILNHYLFIVLIMCFKYIYSLYRDLYL